MNNKCFDYIDGYDTGNRPVFKRKCFCESTACLHMDESRNETEDFIHEINKINYPLITKLK